jgi:hypothetical protein
MINYKDAFSKIFSKPEKPMARAGDPETSHMAAESVTDSFVSSHYAQILDALTMIGPLGKDGISFYSNLGPNQVARRLKEMQKIGLISLTGKTVKSNSNRQEREWTI